MFNLSLLQYQQASLNTRGGVRRGSLGSTTRELWHIGAITPRSTRSIHKLDSVRWFTELFLDWLE